MPTRAKEKEHFKSIEAYLLDRGWKNRISTVQGVELWSKKFGKGIDKYTEEGGLEWAFGAQIEDDANEGGWRVFGITLGKRT